jgi:uncharacterized DUF497 family protein
LTFEWDHANLAHIARHKITAAEAEQVLQNDPLDLEVQDADGELRFTQVGETRAGRILLVVVTLRGSALRVVTAWDAPSAIKRNYLQQKGSEHGNFT